MHIDEQYRKSLATYLDNLFNWIMKNGWAGWDPYDFWDTEIGRSLSGPENIFQRICRVILFRASEFFPITVRRILKVNPQVNSKAMGLFASAFLQLEAVEKSPRLINHEPAYNHCFNWLEKNAVTTFGGRGWGYHYNWKSRILIPRNTPFLVTSAIIGDAYWLKYKMHGDKKALFTCEEICQFIFNGINRSGYKKDGSFCFSFTPIDNFQVHNSNLLGAEFLIRIGLEVGREDWIRTGILAAQFSLSEIREDGTLNYWSNEQSNGVQQDTSHSGFEIRALNSIACLTNSAVFREAADKYFNTWLKDYFLQDGVPKFTRQDNHILEVHSCAEALLCAVRMFESGRFDKEVFLRHSQGVLSAASELWVQEESDMGYFLSRIYKKIGIKLKVRIPYIRWGEAWMFNALATTLSVV
jgi:hypothetical protein